MMLKRETRVLGIDDAHFEKFDKQKECLVVGAIFRGGSFMDGVLSTKITVDGDDATQKISEMILTYKGRRQLHAVFLNGIAVGGFNVIDIHVLHKVTKIPIIVIVRRNPDLKRVIAALTKLHKSKEAKIIEKIGAPHKINNVYMQYAGTTRETAERLIALTTTHSHIPEPLRIAHLIGQGIILGQSKGRA